MSGIKQMTGTKPQMPDHVASVYKELVDELRSMKQQQWTITNYAILLLAAVFAVAAKGLSVPHLSSKLNVLILATAIIGTGLLLTIQYNMAIARARLDKMENTYFTNEDLESTGLTRKEIEEIPKPDPPPPHRTPSRWIGVHYRSARCFVVRLAPRSLVFVISSSLPGQRLCAVRRLLHSRI